MLQLCNMMSHVPMVKEPSLKFEPVAYNAIWFLLFQLYQCSHGAIYVAILRQVHILGFRTDACPAS